MIGFPDLPIRKRNLGHQTQSLRVIRSEKTVVPAKGGDHARKFGSVNRCRGSGRLHGSKPVIVRQGYGLV